LSIRRAVGATTVGQQLSRRVRPVYRHINPWAGLDGVDKVVRQWLPAQAGIFVEAGANDGIKQSNTLGLERRRRWSGLLVEPIPRLALACAKNRPCSKTANAALVEPADSGRLIEMVDLDLMAVVASSRDVPAMKQHQLDAATVGIKPIPAAVVGRTLSELLDEFDLSRVDFLSLDVEGYERNALRGLDFRRHAPLVALVETSDPMDLAREFFSEYRPPIAVSARDVAFVRQDWALRLGM
jgi:FkbM family methyltransferase